jgi:hypothetical protein
MDKGMDEVIEKALLAHGEWKKSLARMVENGDKTLCPEIVAKDDQCEFGKWLYLGIAPDVQVQPIYNRVRELHAEFHKEASRVLALAFSGRRDEAMEAIEFTSNFARLSGALAFALSQWKFKFTKAC